MTFFDIWVDGEKVAEGVAAGMAVATVGRYVGGPKALQIVSEAVRLDAALEAAGVTVLPLTEGGSR